MKKKFILFDMDGTLAEFGKPITKEMHKFLGTLKIPWGIISGSSEKQFRYKLGDYFDKYLLFSSNGTKVFKDGKLIYQVSLRDKLGKKRFGKLMNYLNKLNYLYQSIIPEELKVGIFIDYRGGLINFSPMGRGCEDLTSRARFVEIDKKKNIRIEFSEVIKKEFPELQAVPGGQIGVDITHKDWDKRYVKRHLKGKDITFFGDELYRDGNDYPLTEIADCHLVKNPQDLVKQLKEMIK